MPGRFAGSCLLFLCWWCVPGAAMEPGHSVVPAWERFGRHGELPEAVAGRVLVTELSCTACHRTSMEDLQPKRGPSLNGAGSRLRTSWTQRFLQDPQQVKPGTTMPGMLDSLPAEERADAAKALAAFLGSRQQSFPEVRGNGATPVPHEFWNSGEVASGRRLYHQIGCVACHQADDDYETVETQPTPLDQILNQLDPEDLEDAGLLAAARRVDSVPLGQPEEKYHRQALVHFLLNPHSVRPAGRMPHFQLGAVEAADLTAWLLRDASAARTTAVADADDQLVQRGRQLFTQLACGNCHSLDDVDAPVPAPGWDQLSQSSVAVCAEPSAAGRPSYSLTEGQQQVLQQQRELSGDRREESSLSAADQVQLTLMQLNCVGCHERDGLGGVGRYRKAYFETWGHIDIGDEGRLPPPLTHAGAKLQPKWWKQVLQGKSRIRPHMSIRMPLFPAKQIEQLPLRMAAADEASAEKEAEVFGDLADLQPAGRSMLDTGCIQCHVLRGEAMPGVVGVDLLGIQQRVRPRWFHDFVLDPGAWKRHTRMPSFFPGGVSQNPNVLDGNAERQIAAIWSYLKALPRESLPPKLQQARNQNYELVPTDRPVVLRTFMKHAGTHAIAVGFPGKHHLAFNAETAQLAEVWKGRFLDAQGTWFVRFAPPAVPLGERHLALPAGPLLAVLNEEHSPWPDRADDVRFSGYRLAPDGTPEFLYELAGVQVRDRFMANDDGLVRTLTLTSVNEESNRYLRLLAADKLTEAAAATWRDEQGLRVSVTARENGSPLVRRSGDTQEVLLPVSHGPSQTVEVKYQW